MATFTGRDLALLLPDKLDVRDAEGEKDLFELAKPKIDQTKKVTRYYPGKKPTWAKEEDGQVSTSNDFPVNSRDRLASSSSRPVVEDRRLARLKNVPVISQDYDIEENGGNRRRRVFEAEIIEDESDGEFKNFLDDKEEFVEGDVEYQADDGEEKRPRRRAVAQEIG
jgi:hypothetical protein